jgi:hypothetical protein
MEDEINELLRQRTLMVNELFKWRDYEPQHVALEKKLMQLRRRLNLLLQEQFLERYDEVCEEFKTVVGRSPYLDHCWRLGCHKQLFEPDRPHCIKCQWMLCECGSCGCDYRGYTIGKRRL